MRFKWFHNEDPDIKIKRLSRHLENGCIEWVGRIHTGGYGRTKLNGVEQPVHRYVWEKKNGKIPGSLVIDHLCRNRVCINVDHLRVVTAAENTLCGYGAAAINKRKTHCKRGHELVGQNLVIHELKNGKNMRQCRICHRRNARESKARIKAACYGF